ncbi:MAG: hypothetical protein JWM20_10 [Patescibacteria group bacterium]|nr:hypothetical protein [Patescibacteria group bacterium]
MITEFKTLEEIKGVATQVIYLAKSVEDANIQLKDLNVAIRKSSDGANKSTRAMMFLTAALVLFALAQVIVAWLSYQTNENMLKVKRNCYQNVLQTSNIDLNYKSCLRNNGLSE